MSTPEPAEGGRGFSREQQGAGEGRGSGEMSCEGRTGSGEERISVWERGITPRGVQSGADLTRSCSRGRAAGS